MDFNQPLIIYTRYFGDAPHAVLSERFHMSTHKCTKYYFSK